MFPQKTLSPLTELYLPSCLAGGLFFYLNFFLNLKNFQACNLKFLFWDAWLVFLIALHATRPKAGVFETMSSIFFIIDVRQDDTYASAGNETFHLWEFSFNWFLITFWLVNPFIPNALFLWLLKLSENRKVFWCFQGVEKGCIGYEWVICKLDTTNFGDDCSPFHLIDIL